MRLYFIAGEDSGDLHSKNLVQALKAQVPGLQTRGVGGDKMIDAGTELIAHIKDINFMGFWEVLKNLSTIRRLFKKVKADIRIWKPDAVILVDYPGFNLRMLPFLKELGLPVYYYVSPQLWAWKKGRKEIIRQYVDRMFVILPFEKDFYAKEGIEVDFVGHPLLDELTYKPVEKEESKTIALLPGSRSQEIKRMLPVMLNMTHHFPGYNFVVAGAPSKTEAFYKDMIGNKPVELRMNQTYKILEEADYALVTSGTATLETALHGVPQVVCYKGSFISYQIGKRLVQVKFIALVNLILDRLAVKELIQHEFNVANLKKELELLMDSTHRSRILKDYDDLREKLGNEGASERCAKSLLDYLGDAVVQS